MTWQDWAAFWSMGGYGAYVWGAYGVTLLALLAELGLLSARRRETLASLRAAAAHAAAAERSHEAAP